MIQFLLIRDRIKEILKKYKMAILPGLKFLANFIIFLIININLGYNEKITGITFVVLLSAIGAFLPFSITILIASILVVLHIYSVSIFLSAIFVAIIALLYLLFIRFAPNYGGLVLLIPILSIFHLEALIPITMGLVGAPASLFAIVPGIVTTSLFTVIKETIKRSTGSMQLEDNLQNYIFVIKSLLEDKLTILLIVAAILVFAVTYICRRLVFSQVYFLATIAGMITNLLVMIVGGLIFGVKVNILWLLIGTLISGGFALLVQFFKYILDYSRVEYLQFEDDEYYYYVTAVPKLSVTSPDLNILKINETRKEQNE